VGTLGGSGSELLIASTVSGPVNSIGFALYVRLNYGQDLSLDVFRQVRPGRGKLPQFGALLQDFVQAGGQDRICVFRKFFVFNSLLNSTCRFESYSGS